LLTLTLVIAICLALGAVMGMAPGRASDQPPAITTITVTTVRAVTPRYKGVSAKGWAMRFKHRTRQLQAVKAHVRERWHPTVDYALRLASAVTGVSYWQMRTVSWCESTHNPFAQNGRYKGLFQLGWSPFGFSPFDPVANALSAAMTVRRDGSWREWQCSP
jgi:hypothetical protein